MKIKYAILFALFMFEFNGIAQDKIVSESLFYYDGVSVFPNPASDQITVSYGYSDDGGVVDSLGNSGDLTVWVAFENKGIVDIVSCDGSYAQQNIQLSKEEYTMDIPIDALKSGIYFVVIRLDDKEPVIKKIVVM